MNENTAKMLKIIPVAPNRAKFKKLIGYMPQMAKINSNANNPAMIKAMAPAIFPMVVFYLKIAIITMFWQ